MNRSGANAILDELFGELVGTMFGTGKHQDLFPVVATNQMAQQIAFVGLGDQMHRLVDQFGRGIAARHFDTDGFLQQAVRQRFDFVRERGREQQRLALLGDHREHFFDVANKTHIEHAIGFVQHQNFNP